MGAGGRPSWCTRTCGGVTWFRLKKAESRASAPLTSAFIGIPALSSTAGTSRERGSTGVASGLAANVPHSGTLLNTRMYVPGTSCRSRQTDEDRQNLSLLLNLVDDCCST